MERDDKYRFTAGEDDSGKRLDRVLRRGLPGAGLSAIFSLIRRGLVRVNGSRAPSGYRVAPGDEIEVRGAPAGSSRPAERRVRPGPPGLPLRIVYEDERVLAIDKPRGRPVHGLGGLDADVIAYLEGKIPPSVSFRPGPCHRLDKGTTGALLFAKSLAGARAAHGAFSSSRVVKAYVALVDGDLESPEHWIDSLARLRNEGRSVRSDSEGKKAETFASPIRRSLEATLAVMRITTGRNHQIRAQSAERGHPLSGDAKYGGSAREGGFILHCAFLGFRDGVLPRALSAPLPADSAAALDEAFGPGAAAAAMAEAERFGAIEWD